MGFKMKGWSGYQNSPVKDTPRKVTHYVHDHPDPDPTGDKTATPAKQVVKRRRKKHARSIRPKEGEYFPGQEEGSQSTHLMTWGSGKGGKFHVWPEITNKTGSGEYEKQSFDQAYKAGEVYEFKNKRRAERFAAGSWKKGKDKREAMKAYRKKKREERKGKIKNLKTNISKIFNPQKYK